MYQSHLICNQFPDLRGLHGRWGITCLQNRDFELLRESLSHVIN